MTYAFSLWRRAMRAAVAALIVTGTTQAFAQPQEKSVDKLVVAARVFMEESRPKLACDLIRHGHGDATRDPDALYILALCSRDLGRLDDSIRYYERLVEVMPEAPRPRSELAALYVRTGRNAEASRLYGEAAALQQGTPGAELFSQLASALISDDPGQVPTPAKRWEATLGASLIHDDNVNGGSTAATTAGVIGGVPIELKLDDGSRPRDSWGTTLSAGGRYLKPLSNTWAVLFQGDLTGTRYFSERDFDTDSAALGAAFVRRSARGTFSIQPNARYVRRDQSLQEATHGLSLNLGRRLAPGVQLSGAVGYFNRRVPVAEANDADGYSSSVSMQKSLANRVQLGGQYLYQYEDAEADTQTRTLHGPSLFATWAVTEAMQLLANYRYVAIDYDERQPLFSNAREDDQHQLSIGARMSLKQWTGQNVELHARYSYTDNQSNLAHYDHERHIATAGVLARF